MPEDSLSPGSPMAMGMCQPAYGGPQLFHQLRPGPPMCTCIPGHPQHSVMLMYGGPAHPAMPMSASSPFIFFIGDPTMGRPVLDIHAQYLQKVATGNGSLKIAVIRTGICDWFAYGVHPANTICWFAAKTDKFLFRCRLDVRNMTQASAHHTTHALLQRIKLR